MAYFFPTHIYGMVFIMDTDYFSLTYELNPYNHLDIRMSAFETENKLSRSLNLTAVSLEIFQLTKPATVCGINCMILGMTYFTKPEMTEVL